MQLEDCHVPYFEYNPPIRSLEPKGEETATRDVHLGELPELELEVTYFLQMSAESLGEENVKMPAPKPQIGELQRWVMWKAQTYKTPGWWQELTAVPGLDYHKKLAPEVQASFCPLRRANKLHKMKNNHQALPVPPCLCQKNFLPPPDSIFACWDIWEIQHEKMVAYACALPFWVEKVNLPTEGKPCLLAGSMIELWEEMECYLSFSDKDVFKGVAPPEETSVIPPEEVTPQSAQPTPAGTPTKETAMDTTVEPAAEKRPPNNFPGWEKVLHSSRPVVAAREIPHLSRGLGQRPHSQSTGEGLVRIPQNEEPHVLTTQLEHPSPTKELEITP